MVSETRVLFGRDGTEKISESIVSGMPGPRSRTRMTPRWEPPAWERLSSYGLEAPTQCCDKTSARAVTAHVRYCRLITIERLCAVIDRAYRFECIDTAEFEFAGNILIPKDNRPSDSFQYSIEMCNRQATRE